MKPFGMRVPVVAGAMAAALLVLLGGQWLYTAERVDRPLREAVAAVPGVASVEVDSSRETVEVDVRLGRVPNLMETYRAIDEAVRTELGERPRRLRLRDSRDRALTDAFYAMNPVIEEGIATGRFTEMADRVRSLAQESGIDEVEVFVDADRVYVQMAEGDSYLYETVARAPSQGASAP